MIDGQGISRRALLGALLLGGPLALLACGADDGSVAHSGPGTRAGDDPSVPSTIGQLSAETKVIPYGNGPTRYGHLDVPSGAAPEDGWPVVVLIHGGFWQAGYGIDLMFDLARSLNDDGWATWNIQYSSLGDDDGGWPGTFDDVATAIDRLSEVRAPALNLDRVIAVGHSAGGHLALWAAARPGLPADAPGANPKIRLAGVVSQAGITDLLSCDRDGLGGGACRSLMGAAPNKQLERYLLASPIERLPTGVPTVLVHGDRDLVVPIDQSRRFVLRAVEQGDDPTLLIVPGADHFAPIDPGHAAWQQVRPLLEDLGT